MTDKNTMTDQDDPDQALQDELISLQDRLIELLQEIMLPSGEDILHDLLFVARYQNDSRHTYKLTRKALEKIVEKYKF